MPMPAKSAKLTLLEGNKSRHVKSDLEKRAANEEKLKMSAENISPPSWLSKTAQKEFKRLAELLKSAELINEADIGHLALYCDAYAQYLSYKNQIKAKGMWIPSTTGMKPNPFILRMKDAAAQMRSFATDLGLSPSARAKLAINLNDDNDDEDDF